MKEDILFTHNEDTVILCALGIGAGTGELDFKYEKNLKVFSTFAVVPYSPAFVPMIAEAKLNMADVLHGEQKIVLHKPIPPSGPLYASAVRSSIYDKGDKGAIARFFMGFAHLVLPEEPYSIGSITANQLVLSHFPLGSRE
ncbi:MAG: hypothetical protein V2J25_11870 [Desulfatiglans sp.]|jgi:hypothetical protein|nr:hypothetical protein [Thermodesulfobacteriota bacterium]MEE4353556.1 hypothetical protein [Desulfatiglans sp.]